MRKKALTIVETDPEIKTIIEEMDEGVVLYKEAEKFMRKQLNEKWKQLVGCHWKQIGKILKDRNVLPADFTEPVDDTKYGLYVEDGIIYLRDMIDMDGDFLGHDSFASFLDFMFKKK
jgi:hypothetical protein